MESATQLTESATVLVVSKTEIQRNLDFLASFEVLGSPFVAIQFSDGKPEFYRSSANGFAHTKNFQDEEIFVDLHHFIKRLKFLPDTFEMSVASNGVLQLYAKGPVVGSTTLFVHTTSKGQAGFKQCILGKRNTELQPHTFVGLDVRHISNLSGNPTFSNGRVLIPLNTGTVIWNGEFIPPTCTYSPKFSFLKLVSRGASVFDMHLTDNGYWVATVDGLTVSIKGQGPDNRMFRRQTLPGTEICKFTADTLLQGLSGAAGLIGDTDFVSMDPKSGVTSRDKFGMTAQWTLDDGLDWPKFHISGAQAKLIVNTLKQAQDEHIVLSDVPTDTAPLLRFTRGDFTVNIPL